MLLFGWDQLDPTNQINYYQTTSARAIASMIGPKTAQGNLWAGADLLPTDQQLATSQSNNRDLRWFPSALISLIPYANYGSLNLTSLTMTRRTLALIWMGNISRWNDPILVATNPKLQQVDQPIILVTPNGVAGTFRIFQTSLMKFLDPSEWPYPIYLNGTWSPQHLAALAGRVVFSAIGNPAGYAKVTETPFSMGVISQSLLQQLGVSMEAFSFISATNQTITPDPLALANSSQAISVDVATGTVLDNFTISDDAWPIFGPTYILIDLNFTSFSEMECLSYSAMLRFFLWFLTDESPRIEALSIGTTILSPSKTKPIVDNLRGLQCSDHLILQLTYEDQRSEATWDAMLAVAMICTVVPVLLGGAALFQRRPEAKAGFYFFLFSTLFGALLLLFAVILFYLVPDTDSICILQTWFVGIGFVLLIVPIVSKIIWCLILVRNSRSYKSSDLSLARLAIPLALALAAQVTILVVWVSVDPWSSTTVITNEYLYTAIYQCASEDHWIWFGIEIGCFVFILVGSFVLYCVNSNQQVRALHDISWSQFTIYNILIFMVILIPLLAGFDNSEAAQYFMVSIGLIFPALFTCLTLYGHVVLPSVFKAFGSAISKSSSKSSNQSGNRPSSYSSNIESKSPSVTPV